MGSRAGRFALGIGTTDLRYNPNLMLILFRGQQVTLSTQIVVVVCSFAVLTTTLPAQDGVKANRAEDNRSASVFTNPAATMLLAAEAGPSSEVLPSAQKSPFRQPSKDDAEPTPELRNIFSVESVRSDEFLARLSAASAAPRLAASAPAPQASGSSGRKMAGWVKVVIVVGATVGGIALLGSMRSKKKSCEPGNKLVGPNYIRKEGDPCTLVRFAGGIR